MFTGLFCSKTMVRPEGFEPPTYWSVVDEAVFWGIVGPLAVDSVAAALEAAAAL
jgi:hypothetical protein